MTVYVDNFGPLVGAKGSHLLADSKDELHAFADELGLKRAWFQDPMESENPPHPVSIAAEMWHYDVSDAKRREAIRLGAKAVDAMDVRQIVEARFAKLAASLEEGTPND